MKNISNYIVSFNKLSKPIKIIIIVSIVFLLYIITASISNSIQRSANQQKYENEIDSVLSYAKTSIQAKGYAKGVTPKGYKLYEVGADNSKIYQIKYTYYHQNVFGNNVQDTSVCWVMTKNSKPISCYNGFDGNYYNLNDWKEKNNWKNYTTPELDEIQQKINNIYENIDKESSESKNELPNRENIEVDNIENDSADNFNEQSSALFGNTPIETDTNEENSNIEDNNVPIGKTYIGIAGIDITEEISQNYNLLSGVYIENIEENSPADKAGLMIGDVITEFDGTKINSINELNSLKNNYEVGDTISLTVYRDNSYITLSVTLVENINN